MKINTCPLSPRSPTLPWYEQQEGRGTRGRNHLCVNSSRIGRGNGNHSVKLLFVNSWIYLFTFSSLGARLACRPLQAEKTPRHVMTEESVVTESLSFITFINNNNNRWQVTGQSSSCVTQEFFLINCCLLKKQVTELDEPDERGSPSWKNRKLPLRINVGQMLFWMFDVNKTTTEGYWWSRSSNNQQTWSLWWETQW